MRLHVRITKPSLEVAPTTLAHKNLDKHKNIYRCYLLTVSNSGPFFADHVFASPRNVPKMFSYTVNFFPLSILWQLTLTFDPANVSTDRVKVNHQGKYLGQRSLRMKVIVRTHGHRQTNRTECSTLTTKVDSRNHVMFCEWLITTSRLTVTVWLLRSNSPSMTSGSHYVSLSLSLWEFIHTAALQSRRQRWGRKLMAVVKVQFPTDV